jgi:hypothetical protein
MATRRKPTPSTPDPRPPIPDPSELPTANQQPSPPEVFIPAYGPPIPRRVPGKERVRAEALVAERAEASKRCCKNCANSTRPKGRWFRRILAAWPTLMVCTNCADDPGTLIEVFAHHVCRNFRPRYQPGLRVPPPEPPTGRFCYIPLTKGRQALVDPEDHEWLCRRKWCAMTFSDGRCYAASHVRGRKLYMHRLLMNPPQGIFVDHINGNGLDNRRCNLRLCTPAENIWNCRKYAGSSRFKGVSRHENGKWLASIGVDSRSLHIGLFADEVEAARVRDRWAFALRGTFAWLNLPEELANADPNSPEFQALRDTVEEKRRKWKEKRQKAKGKRKKPHE